MIFYPFFFIHSLQLNFFFAAAVSHSCVFYSCVYFELSWIFILVLCAFGWFVVVVTTAVIYNNYIYFGLYFFNVSCFCFCMQSISNLLLLLLQCADFVCYIILYLVACWFFFSIFFFGWASIELTQNPYLRFNRTKNSDDPC